MTVEIREVVIRAITSPDEAEKETSFQQDRPAADRETLVRECVRQVMVMLRKREER